MKQNGFIGVFIFLFVLLLFAVAQAEPIPDVPPNLDLPEFYGSPAEPNPLPSKDVVPNPYLAPQSSIHVDGYNSGVVDLFTPLGREPIVTSRSFGGFIGMCLNFFYDADGNLFAFCGEMPDGILGNNIEFQLALIDTDTLAKRASFTLLSLTFLHLLSIPMEFGYMNLDAQGRLIAIDDGNRVLFVGLAGEDDEPELAVLETMDLSAWVDPADDPVASVMPDYDGNRWFMTLGKADSEGNTILPALLGVVAADTQEVALHEFTGEVIENGMAVGPDGIFVTTDHAMYGFAYDTVAGDIEQLWRETYERSTVVKPGVISPYGSGATPTLLGDRYVIITDNADEQINLLVYDRRATPDGERLICKTPLFEPGASANENSIVAVGRSLLVQNWYNAPNMIFGDHSQMTPGLWRVDIREDDSGCDVVWQNDEVAAPGTMKLSTATGLVYGAMQERTIEGTRAWVALAVDFTTGETVYKISLGNGFYKDILYIPVYFDPDGTFYQPVLNGIIAVKDGDPWEGDDDTSLDDDDTSLDDDNTTDDDDDDDNDDDDDDDDDNGCGC